MFVKRWMTKDPQTIDPSGTIGKAMELMKNGNFRRMPVVDAEGLLVGILSREDVLNALPSLLDPAFDATGRALAMQGQVESFMSKAPVVVAPSDPLEKAVFAMRKHKIGGIPVMQEKTLVGILTESDIFKAFSTILGSGEKGMRVELAIEPTGSALSALFAILQDYEVLLNTVNLCSDYSETRHLLTLRMLCDESDEVLDALRGGGFQITSILDRE